MINNLNQHVKISATVFAGIFFIIVPFIIPLVQKNALMASNIEKAIDKGIDPITVRCAYAPPTDNICLAYSITHKSIEAPEVPKRK